MKAYRNTVQKDTVMEIMKENKGLHLTADQINALVHERNPLISRSTVFRILNQLSERGDILRVRVPNGADCFDYNSMPHYHVKCNSCGTVCDVDIPILTDINDMAERVSGYKITEHCVIFNGICPDCLQKL